MPISPTLLDAPGRGTFVPGPEALYDSEKDKHRMSFQNIMLDYPDIGLHIKHVLFSSVHALKEVSFCLGKEDISVLYYGDSTFNFINGVDRYHTQLDALFTARLKARVVSFHKNWFDSRVLHSLASMLPVAENKLVVIPINLKFLSDFEYYCPMGVFPILDIAMAYMQKEITLDEAMALTFFENLKSTYDDRLGAYLDRQIDGISLGRNIPVREVEQEMKSSPEYRMVVRYCHDTALLEPKLERFVDTIMLLRGKGYTPLCYLTPLPVFQMKRMIPGHYPVAVRNVKLIREVLGALCHVEDYSHLLPEEETYDTATHLTIAGAEKVAVALAGAARAIFPTTKYTHPDALYRVDTSQILRCAAGEGRFITGYVPVRGNAE